ncbi:MULTISPECIES: ribosome small subunit-dependent GTPase A [unclassified Curtobacterium]|uniref:ribosome small subunit-dependent GTPase A n=1 Tax=unclassified Curtobacterium TaxID=257496 RepID=UPI0008DC93C3|nr:MULTISPECIES: ribosome small subunit-dependent GTPase A [unclassified Curtobacterium]OIH99926.1 ribosome small subunit-dependent GTPase A [Curtobacterium sp. MCBA15_003]OII11839.1 ribosome small subunit-dependent GTPase A [Curtobacterium sp. MCBA15_009]OII30856.1 ribosome small subunit-dependent GTPase A [Curtobacterium sp. MMLR14_006]
MQQHLTALGMPDGMDLTWTTAAEGRAGRVTVVHGAQAEVLLAKDSGELEEVLLPLSRSLATTPVAGDWVLADGSRITALGPRTTNLSRPDPSGVGAQVLAANIDHVLMVLPLERGLNVGALERLTVMAWDSGATPLTVLTKADLATDLGGATDAAAQAAPGVEVVLTSSVTGTGLDRLREIMVSGTTTTMLGASGAGKTSLLNAIDGRSEKVLGVSPAGEGRHATTSRRLYRLSTGGVLLDVPGIRSLDLIASDHGVDETFAEIHDASQRCRFRDCSHTTEPDCAVLAAVVDGTIEARRLANWRKIHREMAYQERRGDAAAMSEQRAEWKSMTKLWRKKSS